MSHTFALTDKAKREFEKLDPQLRKRIEQKLRYFFGAENPMKFAKPLADTRPATHRFRIWKLRVKFFRKEGVFYITNIEFRDKVYRRV